MMLTSMRECLAADQRNRRLVGAVAVDYRAAAAARAVVQGEARARHDCNS